MWVLIFLHLQSPPVSDLKQTWIFFQNDEFFLASEGPHAESVEMLLYIYHTQDLPTAKVMLTIPYKLHEKYKPG